ncbi:1-aminocyclopropane-1-carboxylate deaminase [Fusarium tjaetaba]|uniref:1-aminocyclopropane-1-carboxylate deaminase n=1 Tax=Fusarium tjaetaba TaxID=1567544 RepID=A0A8H5VRJ2_9HYPO|nr:1-aminocyclopropane-1-carboxylate deaminase [Fusarium tjaetaba]KAF5632971.1 1-aminocyclopropane-1-carboxylate deaminase [Fusarium tjaetaba]
MTVVTLPEPFASIPRENFLFGASPLQPLPRISAALGGKVNVYAKREDCNSGLAYGGNKVRKLEYLAAEAQAQGCDTLVSIGGVQSNHTRAVTAVATKLGLKAATVQEHWVDWEDPGYEKVGNIQLSRLMGGDVRLDPSTFGIEHKTTLAKLTDELKSNGRKPYYIPAGASDHPLGGLGFARWAFEVEAQEKELGIFFDTIIVCAVTGSTFAGMIAGFKLAQKKNGSPARKIIGIDASGKVQQTFDQVLRIAKSTAVKIGLSEDDITADDVILDPNYNAKIYGIPDETTIEAMKFGAATEAFITDPVYEGKSLAGMMDLIKTGKIASGNVLYAHLGEHQLKMVDFQDTKVAVLSALTDFFNISSQTPKDAGNHLLETSYVIQSTPNTIEQTTLGELFLNDTKKEGHLEWAIDEPQEIFIHEKLAAVWTGWSIRADDGTIISHKKGILGLAYTDGRWKVSGLASTERSLETPTPEDERDLTQEIMKPINALLDDFSHPDWDVLKQWFLPNAGVTLYRPPAEPAPMTMEQSIVRLQGMIKSGITIQEKLHDIQVRKHGDIALVWAPFVVEINGVPKHDGVNAFTLLRRDGRWVFSGCQDYGVALQ